MYPKITKKVINFNICLRLPPVLDSALSHQFEWLGRSLLCISPPHISELLFNHKQFSEESGVFSFPDTSTYFPKLFFHFFSHVCVWVLSLANIPEQFLSLFLEPCSPCCYCSAFEKRTTFNFKAFL